MDSNYNYEEELMIKIAWYYYIENLTQQEIAKILGINRIKILRSEVTGQWAITDKNSDRGNVKVLTTYGTKRINAYEIIETTLNLKDVRIFVNTIDHAIRLMTDNGVPATAHREERDGYIEYTVRIPTAAAQR